MCSTFLKYKKEHNNVHIYRDSSKMENQVGFAAGLLAQTLNGRLPYAASLFTTEMYAVKTGIEELIRSNSPSGS